MASEDQAPTSKEELNAELETVLRQAFENQVNVRGGFECRNGAGHPDWDVVVTEVEKNGQSQ